MKWMKSLATLSAMAVAVACMAQTETETTTQTETTQTETTQSEAVASPTTTTTTTASPQTGALAWGMTISDPGASNWFNALPNKDQFMVYAFMLKVPDEAEPMVLRALSTMNAQGATGVTRDDMQNMLMESMPDADRSNFQSMWNNMDFVARFSILQLARDAYNGGLADDTMTS